MKVINDNIKEVNKDWKSFTKNSQWEIYFKEVMPTNESFLKRGLLVIYRNQTLDEQLIENVTCKNGIGFTKSDGRILSNIAKRVEENIPLSKKELDTLKIKLPKYWRQLMAEAKSKLNKGENE